MIALSFTLAGLALVLGGFAAQLLGHLETYQANGLTALGNALFVIVSAINGTTVLGMFNAACGGWAAYLWWKGGGGDDTKRRLRSAWKPFVGVRRTAPQGAA